jgi:hypothetical protein
MRRNRIILTDINQWYHILYDIPDFCANSPVSDKSWENFIIYAKYMY